MKQSSKSSASMGGNGDFDEELQSGHHNHTYNNCNNIHHHHHHHYRQVHHHHHHYHNEASGDEERNPSVKQADLVKVTPSTTDEEQNLSVKQADPVKVTPSSTDEEQKPTETTIPTQALPINDSPPTEKPYVLIQSVADPNYFLSVRDRKVIVSLFALGDESQHWYQYIVNNPPDKFGRRCCCLVNKATGQAIKVPDQDDSPADLITYDDGSIVWKTPGLCWFVFSRLCTSITPFDRPQFNLEANFSSRGTSDDGAIVYVTKKKFRMDNSNYWLVN